VSLVELQRAVLGWYEANGRDLAFRRTADPWAILVSEVMAQQTQAARAAEAWTRFMAAFPSPTSLAAATPATVVRAWRGLGYNRRSLALRAAAIEIEERHGGRVPNSLEALVALPGVGPYTARAVLAIAFAQPVAALDVNIRRVVGRAFADVAVAPRELQAIGDSLVPRDHVAEWTHALMDIGAAFCRPTTPRCEACPLRAWCTYAATQLGGEAAAPRARSRPATAAPIRFELTNRWLRGRILDRLREAPDGAWVEFDGAIGTHAEATVAAAVAQLGAEGMIESMGNRARLGIA
jgi:A/G-specific adenine glycosylase